MKRPKLAQPSAIVHALAQPRPLCCQHCFADHSLMPLAVRAESLFSAMGLHIDLIQGQGSHEMPRDFPEGASLLEVRLQCRREACQQLTILVITASETGTFVQLIPAETIDEDDDAPAAQPD